MGVPFGRGIVLVPMSQVGAPTTGTWEEGTVILDANHDMFICDVTGTPGTWGQSSSWPSIDGTMASQADFLDTFVNGCQAGNGWNIALNSTGTLTHVASPTGVLNPQRVIGVVAASTGTNAAGAAGAILGSSLITFASDNAVWTEINVHIPVLSVAAQRFHFRAGFIDSNTATDPVDGLYFSYEDATSPNWLVKVRSSNSQTLIDTQIPVVANDWTRLYMQWNGHGPYVNATINGVWAQTIPLINMPTAAGRETSLGFTVHKVTGTTARVVNVDRIVLRGDQW